MNDYPIEIEQFHQTLNSLKGIENVSSGIDNLEEVKVENLSGVEFSHLPLAALLRTNGGFENEIVLQFEFTIDKTTESLISLEFLSWFIRDQSRGGIKLQLRPFALPPQIGEKRQLGQTLKFQIDYFISDAPETLEPILELISKLNKALTLFIKLNDIPLK